MNLCRCLRQASLLCPRCASPICSVCARQPVCMTCGEHLLVDVDRFEDWALAHHLDGLDRARWERIG